MNKLLFLIKSTFERRQRQMNKALILIEMREGGGKNR